MSKFLKLGKNIAGKGLDVVQNVEAAGKAALHGKSSGEVISELTGTSESNHRAPAFPKIPLYGTLHIILHGARGLPVMDSDTKSSDPYIRVKVDGTKGPRTATMYGTLEPRWEETINLPVTGEVGCITLVVKDDDRYGTNELIGSIHLSAQEMCQGIHQREYQIPNRPGLVCVSSSYSAADASMGKSTIVESTFPVRKGCRVTFYQDAHSSCNHQLPQVIAGNGTPYQPRSYFEDLYWHITQAQHLIYITGWAVWVQTKLLRERALDQRGTPTLGELLKEKAANGVTVCLLLWDEVMSIDNKAVNLLVGKTKKGLMSTHDEETRKYFSHTNVCVELAMRNGKQTHIGKQGSLGVGSKLLGYMGTQALFTHHQKTVILDTPSSVPGRNKLVAFVGGIDLTNGRYDDPSHRLFSTLNTVHHEDVLQRLPNFNLPVGPRQPWHDIHSKVEGPVAWDVLANFEQRWRKQAKSQHQQRLFNTQQSQLLRDVEDTSQDWSAFDVQVFRSIDSYSADIPQKQGQQQGGYLVEQGILEAYIKTIRRAQHCIYIENQYFLGSAQDWIGFDEKKFDVECKHRIPIELTFKIVDKIHRKEPFCCYILIPLQPEGLPEGGATQAILYWQFKTVEMMYAKIHDALKKTGSTAKATDYLSFFCLGNREPAADTTQVQKEIGQCTNDRQKLLLQTRRHMIYIHSKLMIVDDEYIILGSANINERSMAGDRDTEICIGACQPQCVVQPGTGVLPQGDVASFRLSLFAEHTMTMEDTFKYPHSFQCMQRLRQIGDYNWAQFAGPDVQQLGGHLMTYPYTVDPQTGVVGALCQFLPDSEAQKALLLGKTSDTIPNILTT